MDTIQIMLKPKRAKQNNNAKSTKLVWIDWSYNKILANSLPFTFTT